MFKKQKKPTYIESLESMLTTIKEWIERNQDNDDPLSHSLINTIRFIVLSAMDLSTLKNALFDANSIYTEKVFIRFVAITLFEAIDDCSSLIASRVKEFKLANEEKEISELSDLHKKLNKIKNDSASILKIIRNTMAAHREHDTDAQIALIESLSTGEILEIANLYDDWIVDFLNYSAKEIRKNN